MIGTRFEMPTRHGIPVDGSLDFKGLAGRDEMIVIILWRACDYGGTSLENHPLDRSWWLPCLKIGYGKGWLLFESGYRI